MMHGLQFPLEPSGSVAHMGGLTCLEIVPDVVPGDGPICLLEFRNSSSPANKLGSI